MKKEDIKKVVLAYSGGLDTSIIIPWLKENYNNCEVIAVSGNVGQADELEGLEEKAIKTGASKLYVLDLTEEYVDEYIIPTMKAGAVYEEYLLGTSHARLALQRVLLKLLLKRGQTLSVTVAQVRATTRFVSSLLSSISHPKCLLSLLGVSGISNPVMKRLSMPRHTTFLLR